MLSSLAFCVSFHAFHYPRDAMHTSLEVSTIGSIAQVIQVCCGIKEKVLYIFKLMQ